MIVIAVVCLIAVFNSVGYYIRFTLELTLVLLILWFLGACIVWLCFVYDLLICVCTLLTCDVLLLGDCVVCGCLAVWLFAITVALVAICAYLELIVC